MTIRLMAWATGKVFPASMQEEHVAEIIKSKELHKYKENTIADPGLYL